VSRVRDATDPRRLAGYVSHTGLATGESDLGLKGTYFREEIASIDREDLPQATRRETRARVSRT
jgi:hypothetical protein